ncbi:MAG: abortive infection protein [Anaerolineaceae bacterium]|nr:MAG: abortive infection protein [Anaerolineaceae bacterium]
MNEYLDLARLGKNHWWRYLLGVLTILFVWQIIGSIPVAILIVLTLMGDNHTVFVTSRGVEGMDVTVYFVAFMLASWAFLAGIFLAVRFIHQRPLRTLVTPARSIDWGRLFQAFGVWFWLAALTALLEAFLYPGRYVLTLDLPRYLPFIFLALALVPIQTSAEELFFRGYILQGFGLRIRNLWVLSAISGLFFGLPHLLNPEASANYFLMGLFYFAMGAVMAYITLREGRLELALGMHAANNLFSALFANYTGSVMPTPALFTVTELDVVYSVLSALAAMVIFVLIFTVLWRRKPQAEPPAG